jgi:hypothetical protein
MDPIHSNIEQQDTALFEAYQRLDREIPHLTVDEVHVRLVAFSLREIDRAQLRINQIPSMAEQDVRALYRHLIQSYVASMQVAS